MPSITINKHANGYAIEARDPGADKHNKDPKKPYISPHKTFVFTHKDHVKSWLDKYMDPALQDHEQAEYDSAFDKAAAKVEATKGK